MINIKKDIILTLKKAFQQLNIEEPKKKAEIFYKRSVEQTYINLFDSQSTQDKEKIINKISTLKNEKQIAKEIHKYFSTEQFITEFERVVAKAMEEINNQFSSADIDKKKTKST